MVLPGDTHESDFPQSQENGDIVCVCGSSQRPQSIMACNECKRSWHSSCVGLEGLTKSLSDKIKSWKCPLCFQFTPDIKEKLGADVKTETEKLIIGGDNVAKELYKEILDIKEILINRVVPNTDKIEAISRNASSAVKETLDENMARQTQTWAEVVANKQEIAQKSLEKAINMEQRKIVTEAMDTSRQKAERDHVEREKRRSNVVIRDLPESTEASNEAKREHDKERVVEIMDIDSEYVVNVYRAGAPKSNYNRPIIITLTNPEVASGLHNYGRGMRRENVDGSLFYWVNADLIQADRIANFNAREEARTKRQPHGNRSSPQQRRGGARRDDRGSNLGAPIPNEDLH